MWLEPRQNSAASAPAVEPVRGVNPRRPAARPLSVGARDWARPTLLTAASLPEYWTLLGTPDDNPNPYRARLRNPIFSSVPSPTAGEKRPPPFPVEERGPRDPRTGGRTNRRKAETFPDL